MKKITLFSNLWRSLVGSREDESRTLLLVAPLKLMSVFTMLTIGVPHVLAAITPLSLPHDFGDVGKGDFTDALGCTYTISGTNYDNDPKLKFTTQGNHLTIQLADAPSSVSYHIKGNSFSEGTFKLQESADGSSYTDVASYTTLGSTTQNEIKSLKSTTRYIKFVYTTKSLGNVALGSIAIAKATCIAVDVTDGDPVILPAGSESYTTSDWENNGAPSDYTAGTYNINGYCVTFSNAGDYDKADGLQMKKNSEGILSINGITSTNGVDVDVVIGSSSGLSIALNGADTLTEQTTGTTTISTTSTSANLVITNTSSNASYVKYIKISPKASSCSNTVTFADNSPTNGSIAFSPTSLETCSETATDRQATMTITPTSGYTLTGFSYSTGDGSVSPNSNTSSPSTTANSAAAQEITLKFDQNDAGTCTANATFSEMVVTSWSWTMHDGGGAISDPLNLYVGQKARFDVAYTPSGVLSGHKTYTRAKDNTYINWDGALQSGYSTIEGKASTGDNTTEVSFTHADDFSGNVKTVNVKVLPLPLVHFVDQVHEVSFADVAATIVDNALSATKKTPTHADYASTTYNDCEDDHVHLIGWILKDWADENPNATHSEISGAGASNFFATNADINVSTYNGKTFYAVWAKEVEPE